MNCSVSLKWIICTVLILIPLVPALSVPLSADYFPPNSLDAGFIKWFGPEIMGTRATSLYQLSKKDHQSEIYRLTIFPPFAEIVSMQMEEQKDGTGVLTLLRINQGGEGPWTRKAKFLLTQSGMNHFHGLMDKINFWQASAELKNEDAVEDGTEFLYEGLRNGKYHVAMRVYPSLKKEETFYAPAFYLLKLANESTEGF